MGIYSTQAAQILKESDVEFNPNAAGLLEFVINSQRADQAMFDTMIELDFREAYIANGQILVETGNEAEDKANTESKASDGIFKKIISLLEKAAQTIMRFLEKLGNIVLEKTKIDKALVKHYGDLDLAKIKANLTDKDKEKTVTLYEGNNKLSLAINDLNDRFAETEYNNVVMVDVEAQKKSIESTVSNATSEENFKSLFKDTKIGELSDVSNIKKTVDGGYKALADDIIGSTAAVALDKLKKARSAWAKNKEKKEANRELYNSVFAEINYACSGLTKLINFGSTVTSHALASYRKAYVTLGQIQNRKAKEEKKDAKAETQQKTEAVPESYNELLGYAIEAVTDVMYDDFTLA